MKHLKTIEISTNTMEAITQKNTLLKTAQGKTSPKFLREYFFRHAKRNSIFFIPHLCVLFFANLHSTTDKNLDWPQIKIIRLLDTVEKARTGNKGYT